MVGFTNRTDMLTLADGRQVALRRYGRQQDAAYRLRMMQGLAEPAAEAGIPLPRVQPLGGGSVRRLFSYDPVIRGLASWGYPKTKLQAEQIVASSGLPWTILRVTQFYDYCLTNAQKPSRLPVAPVPAGITVQPVDPRDVAERLVELALSSPVGRAPDMAGPQVSDWTDLLRVYLKARRRRRWVLLVRIPGTRAVRNGALLPPPGHTVGSRTWDQFLNAQLLQQAPATA
ncbi:MAG: hypothetical protein WBH47_23910 [Streptosporangiaceae bacterium]